MQLCSKPVYRQLQINLSVRIPWRHLARPDIHLNGRQEQNRRCRRPVPSYAGRHELILFCAIVNMHVVLTLLFNGGVPSVGVATGWLVVVAHPQMRIRRK